MSLAEIHDSLVSTRGWTGGCDLDKIQVMSQELVPKYKVQADSIADVKSALHACARRLADRDVKFRGRVLRTGPLLTALVVHFLALSDEAQDAVAENGLQRLESLMAEESPLIGDIQTKDEIENDRIVARLREAVVSASRGSVHAVPAPHEFEGPPIPETGVGPGRLLNDPEPKRKRPRKAK